MPRMKKDSQYLHPGEKDCWHPLGLQSLADHRFTTVVNNILIGKYSLIRKSLKGHMSIGTLLKL